MQLPDRVKGALSTHLAGRQQSEAPHLDGTAAVDQHSDDPGLWHLNGPPVDRLDALKTDLEMRIRFGIDQLGVNTEQVARAADASFQHRAHVQLAGLSALRAGGFGRALVQRSCALMPHLNPMTTRNATERHN